MIMGIPIALAQQMAVDLDESFICKRSRIAYPEERIVVKPQVQTCTNLQKASIGWNASMSEGWLILTGPAG
jgi:hypothetical protein